MEIFFAFLLLAILAVVFSLHNAGKQRKHATEEVDTYDYEILVAFCRLRVLRYLTDSEAKTLPSQLEMLLANVDETYGKRPETYERNLIASLNGKEVTNK